MCVSGQWKVKFDQKPKKGHFTKLGGDMVTVPLLYHQKYMVAMTYVVELKAQVTNTHLNPTLSHLLYTAEAFKL